LPLQASTEYVTAPAPDVVQALYFSVVTATTLGFGDITPLNATGLDACGARVTVHHWGMSLVIAELTMTVVFALVFITIFLSRSSERE
jgi:Ion channel